MIALGRPNTDREEDAVQQRGKHSKHSAVLDRILILHVNRKDAPPDDGGQGAPVKAAPNTLPQCSESEWIVAEHRTCQVLFYQTNARSQNRNAIGHRSRERIRAHVAAIARSAVSFDDVKETPCLLHGKPLDVVRD